MIRLSCTNLIKYKKIEDYLSPGKYDRKTEKILGQTKSKISRLYNLNKNELGVNLELKIKNKIKLESIDLNYRIISISFLFLIIFSLNHVK